MIDPRDSNNPLKKCDDSYYEMVRLVFINDYKISLVDAAKDVSNKQGYETPNYNTLRSIKSRKALIWEKRNTNKTIKSKVSKKADSIALKNKVKNATNKTDGATLHARTPPKKAQSVATKRATKRATDVATDDTKPVATKRGQLLPVGGKRTARLDADLGVEETARDDDVEPVHDNETIDLRAVILDRQRTNLESINNYLMDNIHRVNKASTRIEAFVDLVIENPLLSSQEAAKEDKEAVLAMLNDNPIIKALNILLKTAKSAIYATSEAMRGVGTIQAAERVAWDLDNYGDDDGNEALDIESEDEHYQQLEYNAQKSKIEMLERSAKLRALSAKLEQRIDEDANIGIQDDD